MSVSSKSEQQESWSSQLPGLCSTVRMFHKSAASEVS
jgi:hypothetical protein